MQTAKATVKARSAEAKSQVHIYLFKKGTCAKKTTHTFKLLVGVAPCPRAYCSAPVAEATHSSHPLCRLEPSLRVRASHYLPVPQAPLELADVARPVGKTEAAQAVHLPLAPGPVVHVAVRPAHLAAAVRRLAGPGIPRAREGHLRRTARAAAEGRPRRSQESPGANTPRKE